MLHMHLLLNHSVYLTGSSNIYYPSMSEFYRSAAVLITGLTQAMTVLRPSTGANNWTANL